MYTFLWQLGNEISSFLSWQMKDLEVSIWKDIVYRSSKLINSSVRSTRWSFYLCIPIIWIRLSLIMCNSQTTMDLTISVGKKGNGIIPVKNKELLTSTWKERALLTFAKIEIWDQSCPNWSNFQIANEKSICVKPFLAQHLSEQG